MSERPRITEEEAQQFLELYTKIMSDMDETFQEVSDDVFSDEEQGKSDFVENWDGTNGSLYTTCSRRKIKRFVENMYLD